MPQDTALTIRVSENAALSSTLLNLRTQLETAARENINAVLQTAGTSLDAYTDLEQRAMVLTEALRGVNSVDLATILLRGQLLQEIEAGALHTVHPEHYNTLEDMAQAQGISLSELSDIRMMTQTIFPYIENTLGIPVAQVWETMGKSNFRALVPVLRAIITGEEPGRGSARDNYNRILNDTAASLAALNGGSPPDDQTVRRQAVEDLMVAGQQMTARELREHVRDGQVTPALEPVIIEGPDGQQYLLSPIDDDQMLVVQRKLGRHMSPPTRVNLPQDRRRRQQEAFRVAVIRQFNDLIDG